MIDKEKAKIEIKKIIDNAHSNKILTLVDKTIFLNEQFNVISEKKTIQSRKLEDEIEKISGEIDQEVYKLYGLNNKEIKIVEESLK
ncbi:MAG: hypothetical protein ABIC04_03330 [Nanoarchaeota archaeon]